MFWLYVTAFTVIFFVIVLVLLRALHKRNLPPNDDGGFPPEENLPVIDLPPSCTLEDYLVDRWHQEAKNIRIR